MPMHEVDVFVAVDIPHSAVLRPGEEQWHRLLTPANLAGDAARDQALGLFEQGSGFGVTVWHGVNFASRYEYLILRALRALRIAGVRKWWVCTVQFTGIPGAKHGLTWCRPGFISDPTLPVAEDPVSITPSGVLETTSLM